MPMAPAASSAKKPTNTSSTNSPKKNPPKPFSLTSFTSTVTSPKSPPRKTSPSRTALLKTPSKSSLLKRKSPASRKGHIDADWWADILTRATEAIADYHKTNPDLPGIQLQSLRNSFAREFAHYDLFDSLLESLQENDIQAEGEYLKALSHQTDIPPELKKEADAILKTLATEQLNAPNKKELAPTPAAQRALAFLIRVGQVVSLDERTVLDLPSFDLASDKIEEHLTEYKSATASDLRQLLGTSRRITMPLLERLDSNGVTRRDGDFRYLAL